MKKAIVSGAVIASFILYAIINGKSMDSVKQTETAVISATPTLTPSPESVPADSSPSPTPTPVPVTASARYKDGEYTGDAVDAFYGNIQVKAVIQDGKITDVRFLQYPNDHHESIEINERAMPLLTQEAINAQSADVEVVSRATDSSNAFVESLSSALRQAQS